MSLEYPFIRIIKKDYDDILIESPLLYRKIYDYLVYLFHNFPHKASNRFIHKLCKRFNLKGKSILDVGSFTGYYSFYLRCERNMVTGIEISNKVDYAINRFGKYDISFVQGGAIEFLETIPDRSFDFIFCSNFPAHYDTGDINSSKYMPAFINSAIKKLKKDGVLYYLFYSDKHRKVFYPVSEKEMEIFLSENKITNYHINHISPIDYEMLEVIIKSGF